MTYYDWFDYPHQLGRHEENRTIIADITPLFWNLLYALPFIYPDFSILHAYFTVLAFNPSVLRDYHALFIFNHVDDVLIVNFHFFLYDYCIFINSMSYEILPLCSIAMRSIRNPLRTFSHSQQLLFLVIFVVFYAVLFINYVCELTRFEKVLGILANRNCL